MRPLEAALLVTNLLAFLSLFRRLRLPPWLRWAGLVGLPLAASAQLLLEGRRWQMIPAYALSAAILAACLLQRRRSAGRSSERSPTARFAARASAALAVVALAVSVALPILFPMFRFPPPTGPHAIGTLTYHFIDSARPEIFTSDPNRRRELMVQVWYPAKPDPAARRAPYVEDAAALAPLARLLHLPAFTLGHLADVKTNAIPRAAVADGGAFPVLIFSHGRAGYRQHNTFQVEELVSHGYVVAAIDHPYAAAGVVFPDGRVAAFDQRMFDPAHPGHPAFLETAIPFLARDALFTLDRLADLNQADSNGTLTGRLDLQRAGMFGLSLGGAVTAEACRLEPRLRACLVMDVFVPADVARDGFGQPTMWIGHDAASMKREGWAQADIDETESTVEAAFARVRQDSYRVELPGAFHPNFSDLPLITPLARPLGLIGPIDAARAHRIINDFSLAFFDRHLSGRPAALLDRPADRYPDVRFETRRPPAR